MYSDVSTRTIIEAGVLKDLKLRCSKWIPNDLGLEFHPKVSKPFHFFPRHDEKKSTFISPRNGRKVKKQHYVHTHTSDN